MATATVATLQLPVFMLGGLGPFVRSDTNMSTSLFGAALSLFFLGAAVASPLGGAASDRSGAYRPIRSSLVLSAFGVLIVVATGGQWWGLAVGLLLCGFGVGVAQPASNVIVVDRVPADSHGPVFGIKQSATPLATLGAGLVVPAIGQHYGWAVGILGVLPLLALCYVGLLSPVGAGKRHSPRSRLSPRSTLAEGELRAWLALALVPVFGFGAFTGAATFTVESVSRVGAPVELGGIILATASIISIAFRVVGGATIRYSRHSPLRFVQFMLGIGAVGCAVAAWFPTAGILPGAALVGMSVGSGWTGLLLLAVVRAGRGRTGTASSITATGFFIGGMVGPSVFGWALDTGGVTAGWSSMALGMLLAMVTAMWAQGVLHAGGA